ncbi:MAG: arginine deiminase-related protein [Candidatus Poseidoniales archaeon]|jgi:dimethylargininase
MATVRLDQKKRALVRGVPSSFTDALARYFGSGPTNVDLARAQQQAYIDALEANGVSVHRLDADENHPDCMFVEDQAVVVDGHMLLPTPGHPSRVAEQPPIAEFLMQALEGVQTCTMGGEARMDGGDIIRLGNLFFVGRSSRTNDKGIVSLQSLLDFFGHELRVIDIPEHALHLTSISSTPTDSLILVPEGYLKAEDFGQLPEGCELIWLPSEEAYGCNTIGLPNGKVMVAKGYPTVQKVLEERGLETIEIDMSEIRAADGSLTCCSIFY